MIKFKSLVIQPLPLYTPTSVVPLWLLKECFRYVLSKEDKNLEDGMKFKLQLCLKIAKNSRKIIVDFVQAKQSLDCWKCIN